MPTVMFEKFKSNGNVPTSELNDIADMLHSMMVEYQGMKRMPFDLELTKDGSAYKLKLNPEKPADQPQLKLDLNKLMRAYDITSTAERDNNDLTVTLGNQQIDKFFASKCTMSF